MMKTAVLEKKQETAIEMAARTIVLIVTFSGIGNRRKVDTSRVQVDADKELIAVSKQLFESEALWEIQALDSEARRYIESRALPSMLKKGVYLLPLELVTEVETKLSEYAAQRHMFADKLKETYDEAVNQSKKRLRDLFDASDYPSAAEVASAFQLTWRYVTFNIPVSLKQISQQLFAAEQAKTEKAWAELRETIQELLRANMHELVSHLAHVLSASEDGKKRIFRDSALTKVQDFLSIFDARNITDDGALKALVDKARRIVRGVDAEDLRTNEATRDHVQGAFQEMSATLDSMLSSKPIRAFAREE